MMVLSSDEVLRLSQLSGELAKQQYLLDNIWAYILPTILVCCLAASIIGCMVFISLAIDPIYNYHRNKSIRGWKQTSEAEKLRKDILIGSLISLGITICLILVAVVYIYVTTQIELSSNIINLQSQIDMIYTRCA